MSQVRPPSASRRAISVLRRSGSSERQQRVGGQGLLVLRQVDPGEEPVHQAAGEDGHGDERCRAVLGGAGVDRGEGEDAGVADGAAAEAGEGVAVADQRARALRDVALGVRLPDFQDRVRDGVTGAVVDGALQADGARGAGGQQFAVLGRTGRA